MLLIVIIMFIITIWFYERRLVTLEHKYHELLLQLPLPELELDTEAIDAMLDNLDAYDDNLDHVHGPAVLRLVSDQRGLPRLVRDQPYDHEKDGL